MMTEMGIMEECSSAKRIKSADKEFNPPVEMMVHDYDDERTLDEEEALESTEDHQAELSNLQKEGHMPLEELLALYGYADSNSSSHSSNQEEPMEASEAPEQSKIVLKKEYEEEPEEVKEEEEEEEEEEAEPSKLSQLYEDIPPTPTAHPLRLSRPQSEEEEEDYDYSPDEDEWKKTIMVGSDYQAWIPEGLCKYDDALPYENEDKLLWDPNHLDAEEINTYLEKSQDSLKLNAQGVHAIPCGNHIRDDEQALYLLLQCGYNMEEALRRRRMNVIAPTDTMSLWSEEECRNFENGLRTYGKNFHLIQQNKVRTRSVGELVQFYYLWKKTERHDIFANKARLEKKKYTLHPGITDYMDRFLEEQESGGGTVSGASASQRDRSSSPNIQCLIYGDRKRHRASPVHLNGVSITQNSQGINDIDASLHLNLDDIEGLNGDSSKENVDNGCSAIINHTTLTATFNSCLGNK
ncbi:mesoderm induction early response protein 1 isoform X2 [Nilaparvata lugens]|uniref:mesoderm induction early response protein 1 isoform X2 n=1 Tax=Nilaparvata lugens TaxID=108931 RepID=UPI000B9804FF|nr:mesoderm induction early response protein 1 isoform X2 [Nilaparvata lugens]